MQATKCTLPSKRPLHILIMNHVEGDWMRPEFDSECVEDLYYQTEELPPPVQKPTRNSFELDVVGAEFLHEFLQSYTDSSGQTPKLFIEPTGEVWQTEADPVYGARFFRKHDYLASGYEFGIQAHALCYSGQSFCWYTTPPTEEGIARKFSDLHAFAEKVYHKGRKVNGGLTFTGGNKHETKVNPWHQPDTTPMGDAEVECIIDHVAHSLGYRISFEAAYGHLRDKPPTPGRRIPAPYVYQADWGDGVRIIKIDCRGALVPKRLPHMRGGDPPAEAMSRFDGLLAAKARDQDPTHLYYFAIVLHGAAVWVDFHMAEAGHPLQGTGWALKELMDAIEQRKNKGERIEYIAPSALAKKFWDLTS